MPFSSLQTRYVVIILFLLVGLTLISLPSCQTSQPAVSQTTPGLAQAGEQPVIFTPTMPVEGDATENPAATSPPVGHPLDVCSETAGRIEKFQFISQTIAKSQRLSVYFPPCFNPEKQGGYPAVFLLHGQGQDENFWADAGIDKKSDTLILSGKVLPYLVIMPYEEYNVGDILESNFDEMFIDELIPWVQENLPATADYRQRAVGGISRGAYWAFRLAFKYHHQFGSAGVHSIPFFGEPNALKLWIGEINRDELPRLYLDTGKHDRYLNDALKFKALLDQYHIAHEWHLNEGEHNADYWTKNLEDYLLWYTKGWEWTPSGGE